jgi:hypothetical protein
MHEATLQKIPIRNRPVAQRTQLLGRISTVRTFSHLPLALPIDPLVVEHQHEQGEDTRADESELESMPEDIPRRIFCSVEVGCHCLEVLGHRCNWL